MPAIKSILAASAALLTLSACQINPQGSARHIPLSEATPGRMEPHDWSLSLVEVVVPDNLSVSEDNTIKPRADIVWREDPCCDRHAQIDDLMTQALNTGLTNMAGSQPVTVQVQVTRFHAVTERTRYTLGGEHEVEFILTVFDSGTGEILRGPRAVDVTFPASGGEVALAEEARGYYQRDAITDRLVSWAQVEFGIASLEELQR